MRVFNRKKVFALGPAHDPKMEISKLKKMDHPIWMSFPEMGLGNWMGFPGFAKKDNFLKFALDDVHLRKLENNVIEIRKAALIPYIFNHLN